MNIPVSSVKELKANRFIRTLYRFLAYHIVSFGNPAVSIKKIYLEEMCIECEVSYNKIAGQKKISTGIFIAYWYPELH